ncbi:unnamed protein product [Discula destructiva]
MGADSIRGASTSNSGAMDAAQRNTTASSSTSSTRSRGRKRKTQSGPFENAEDPDEDADQPKAKLKKQRVVNRDPTEEKRLRKFRAKPPYKFAAIYERATTQRFFVLSRTLCGTPADPEAMFEVSGSTGNIYNVCIARQPTCDCPHARAGNQCKHTLFVLKKVLRAREDLVYQLALLSSELREIFAAAPPAPEKKTGAGAEDKNRKALEGDCPICFEEMEAGPGKEALVWCKAACGQNIHKQCFDMWAATKRQSGKVTCPYCRSNWEVQTDTVGVASIRRGGARNKDGYVNIADQLGISTQRDYSTYSQWWSGRSSYRGRRFGGF